MYVTFSCIYVFVCVYVCMYVCMYVWIGALLHWSWWRGQGDYRGLDRPAAVESSIESFQRDEYGQQVRCMYVCMYVCVYF